MYDKQDKEREIERIKVKRGKRTNIRERDEIYKKLFTEI